MIRRIAIAAAVLAACLASTPARACVTNSFDPFVATANARQPDGSWVRLNISAYGLVESDQQMGLSWTLRIEARTQNRGALIDTLEDTASLFPLRRNAAARIRSASLSAASREFGIPARALTAEDALNRSEFNDRQDVRTFMGRACSFILHDDGSWVCFDRTGLALAAGARVVT